jgi:hypothetical protein
MSNFKLKKMKRKWNQKFILVLDWTVDFSVIEEPFNNIQIYFVSGNGTYGSSSP